MPVIKSQTLFRAIILVYIVLYDQRAFKRAFLKFSVFNYCREYFKGIYFFQLYVKRDQR